MCEPGEGSPQCTGRHTVYLCSAKRTMKGLGLHSHAHVHRPIRGSSTCKRYDCTQMQHAEMQIKGQVNGPWLKEHDLPECTTAHIFVSPHFSDVHNDVISALSLMSGHLNAC